MSMKDGRPAAPIATLIADLHRRGLLDRTLVVVASEFGRTIANAPKAGIEPIGFAETRAYVTRVERLKRRYRSAWGL